MKMNNLPLIYKRTQTGAIQQWQIIVKDNSFNTIEGQVGGKMTASKPTIVEGKNTGKKNETTPQEQAFKEAMSKWKKKIEEGYHEDIKSIDKASKFFEPMLSHKYLDYKDDIKFPVLISTKIDGSRLVARKEGLFTRNGKEYLSCPHIHEILKPIFKDHPNWIIDGEIYSHEVPFESIMSLVRKTKPTPEDLTESQKIIQYWIFDGVTDDKSLGFEDRFNTIREEINSLIGKNKNLKFVDAIPVKSHEEIEKKHDEFVSIGFEGAMIRIPSSIYENKRSKNLLKFKKFFDEEFKITDIEEGIGNRSGMAGKIHLVMKNGKPFSSGIRGGEDYYRDLLKNKSKYIGKIATIRYQEKTEDGIPRFPVAVNINPLDR